MSQLGNRQVTKNNWTYQNRVEIFELRFLNLSQDTDTENQKMHFFKTNRKMRKESYILPFALLPQILQHSSGVLSHLAVFVFLLPLPKLYTTSI